MSEDQPATEISIETPPLSITVKGQASAEELAIEALALYRAVWTPTMTTNTGGVVGFVAERE